MRILLIQPPFTLFSHEMPSVVPPLGLAYIGAVLEKAGHEVEILDTIALNWRNPVKIGNIMHLGLKWGDISTRIKRSKPDVVGISCSFSSQSGNAHKIAQLTNAYDADVPVIMGGAHPSSLPERVMEDQNVDYVVIGEGEVTILNILECLSKNTPMDNLNGLIYRESGKTKRGPRQEFVENLDSLPFPARHLLPMKEYFEAKAPHGPELMRKCFTSMITSRGCPFSCIFCSIHTIWGHRWRARSPENVAREIEHLNESYGISEIHFEDDNMTLDRKRMERICDAIIERGLDLKWTTPNGVAAWTLDKNVLEKMKKSGCYKLCFGIESGDSKTLRFIGKPISLMHVRKIIRWANDAGIWTHGFFVIGFPHESKESIEKTLRFATKSDLDSASFFIATPYPGTRLLDIMKGEGAINSDSNWEHLRTFSAAIDTEFYTSKELDSLQKELYLRFFRERVFNYLKPRALSLRLKRIRSKEDLSFLVRLMARFIQIQKRQRNLS